MKIRYFLGIILLMVATSGITSYDIKADETSEENIEIIEDQQITLEYRTYVQKKGWLEWVENGSVSGTVGDKLRMEALQIKVLVDGEEDYSYGGIEYRTHIQKQSWESNYKTNSMISGTIGKALRLEAVQIILTGEISECYNVYYRTHIQSVGWSGWAANGKVSGSEGYGLRLEAIQIQLMKKTEGELDTSEKSYYSYTSNVPKITYRTHIQKQAWQGWKKNVVMSGTSGKALRLEAIQIKVTDGKGLTGGITYRTHVQNQGWQQWVSDGANSGTTGSGLRLEAIQIKLTGELEEKYSVVYRAHAQQFGWLGWTSNGSASGTSGYGYRLEAIQIAITDRAANGGVIYPSGADITRNSYNKKIIPKSNIVVEECKQIGQYGTIVRLNNYMKQYITEYRAANGKTTVWPDTLYGIAQQRSRYMLLNNDYSHKGFSMYSGLCGEDIGIDNILKYASNNSIDDNLCRVVARLEVDGWIESEKHRENLLRGQSCGVACFVSPGGSAYFTYVCKY